MKWLLIYLSLSWAGAQEWSVQVAALSDRGAARAVQKQLLHLGYDAYLTAASATVTRVRVGCFTSFDGAQHFALYLTRQLAQETVAVPLSLDSPVRYCLDREVGFVLPALWGFYAREEQRISFWVETGARRYFISYGGDWQLAQTEAELASLRVSASSSLPELFFETYTEGKQHLGLRWGEADFVIAAGELVWQDGRRAVVLEQDMAVAYHVTAR